MQMISMRLYPVYMSLIYFCLLHTHLRLSPPSVMIIRHQPPPLHSLFFLLNFISPPIGGGVWRSLRLDLV